VYNRLSNAKALKELIMTKGTIIDCWLNNFSDVGFCGGSYNFAREEKYNFLYKRLTVQQARDIDSLHLWEGEKHKSIIWSFDTFCTKLKELGYLK